MVKTDIMILAILNCFEFGIFSSFLFWNYISIIHDIETTLIIGIHSLRYIIVNPCTHMWNALKIFMRHECVNLHVNVYFCLPIMLMYNFLYILPIHKKFICHVCKFSNFDLLEHLLRENYQDIKILEILCCWSRIFFWASIYPFYSCEFKNLLSLFTSYFIKSFKYFLSFSKVAKNAYLDAKRRWWTMDGSFYCWIPMFQREDIKFNGRAL